MTIVIKQAKAIELLEIAVTQSGEEYTDPSFEQGRDCEYFAVKEVSIEANGDVYEDSVILKDEEDRALPGCIIGNVFYQVGLDPVNVKPGIVSHILDFDGYVIQANAPDTRLVTAAGEEVRFTTAAQEVVGAAQAVQDKGKTWGEALAEARLHVGTGGNDE